MSVAIPLIKFLFEAELKPLSEALGSSDNYEVEEMSSASDLSTFLSTVSAALVVASIREKNDLLQIANLVKMIKKTAQTTALKIVVVNFSTNKEFVKAIEKLGIQEVIAPEITTRALKFKIDFWMKSLQAQIKKNTPNKKNPPQKILEKSVENKIALNGLHWGDPLDLEDDIWIIKNESDCKKVLSKWLLRFTGPGPHVGHWIEKKAGLWKFEITSEDKDLYLSGRGDWFFQGDQKPDFVWRENVWLVSGEDFELYYKEEDKKYSRFSSKNKSISLCQNSLYAQTKEQIILEGLDKDLIFKKKADEFKEQEGKGKTDHLTGDFLSGESDEAAARLSNNPLTQKTSTEKMSGFWKGKVETETDKNILGFYKNKVLPVSTEEEDFEELTTEAKMITILTLNNIKHTCLFEDFYDEAITLTLETGNVTSLSEAELDISLDYLREERQLKLTGSILSIEPDGAGRDYIMMGISTKGAVSFQGFLELYEKRQSNVNSFLHKAKGF